MLQNKNLLLNTKNLLAFSAGVDSSALLFLLLENNITFDIAIVDYGLRLQSKKEVDYAKQLAKKYNFKCHLLNTDAISTNFEANARAIRYDFFEELIWENNYDNLLTAHHLGDRLEWMLMQLCKGAGAVELAGMQAIDKREKYQLLRPLLHLDKPELLEYLKSKNIKYFIDASNSDEKYKRNEFRHNFAQPLLAKYRSGIKRSFDYLDEDVASLVEEIKVSNCNQLYYFESAENLRSNIIAIDKHFKSLGLLITSNEKALLKKYVNVIISRKYIVSFDRGFVFITPYIKVEKIEKELKEKLRLLKISPKRRAYLSTDSESVELLSLLLQ